MLLEFIISLSMGIFIGTISGLLPGIHINLVSAIVVSSSVAFLSRIDSIFLVVFIGSRAMTHTFIDFIPSIFLGAPDTDTKLSVLPGHEMLKQGLGFQAVYLTAIGGLFGVFIFILISFPSLFLISKVYSQIKTTIPYILILISLTLIFSERKKFSALFVFLLSGLLGFIVLNLQMKDPLLPLLSGLFGASTLLISIREKTVIPKQNLEEKIKTPLFPPLLGSAISSPLSIFLPALGSGQIAIIGNGISKQDREGFLVLLGTTNTLTMAFSFLALYTISKTRTGASAAINNLIGIPEENIFILIMIIILLSGIASFFLTIFLAKKFSIFIEKVNYTKLSVFTLLFLSGIIFLLSGFFGFFIFIVSTLTGIYCISLNVRRTNLMGCLLVPTILLYLF